MISSLKGILTHSGNNEILLDVNGVGYGVFITKKVSDNLPPIEGELRILTFLDVKETALTLYGFYDEKEQEIFKLLISVSGISSKIGSYDFVTRGISGNHRTHNRKSIYG